MKRKTLRERAVEYSFDYVLTTQSWRRISMDSYIAGYRACQADMRRKAPKSLSEFVRADKATRERIGGEVAERAIAAQQRKAKTAGRRPKVGM
jgi:hypothetical protein